MPVVSFGLISVSSLMTPDVERLLHKVTQEHSIGVTTNVPGPRHPIYVAGGEVLGRWGMGGLSGNMNLSFGIYTLNGKLELLRALRHRHHRGPRADPRLLPGVDRGVAGGGPGCSLTTRSWRHWSARRSRSASTAPWPRCAPTGHRGSAARRWSSTDDGIFIGTAADARKTLDLRRDPRVAVHSPTRDPGPDGAWAGEAKLSGVAVEVPRRRTTPPAPCASASTSPRRSTPA